LLAVVLQATLGQISARILPAVNVFSWVVLYFAVLRHELYGAVMGTVCGLVQDSLSLGIFGVAGLTKTTLGVVAGYVSRKINVTPVTRSFVFLLILATLELALWKFLVFSLFGERFSLDGGVALVQPFLTAFAGTVLIRTLGKTGQAME